MLGPQVESGADASRETTTTPLPSPPPQGGREQTEFAALLIVNSTRIVTADAFSADARRVAPGSRVSLRSAGTRRSECSRFTIAVFVIRVTARHRLSMSAHTPAGGMSSAEPRWRAGWLRALRRARRRIDRVMGGSSDAAGRPLQFAGS
jgi:hypothetical protein